MLGYEGFLRVREREIKNCSVGNVQNTKQFIVMVGYT